MGQPLGDPVGVGHKGHKGHKGVGHEGSGRERMRSSESYGFGVIYQCYLYCLEQR